MGCTHAFFQAWKVIRRLPVYVRHSYLDRWAFMQISWFLHEGLDTCANCRIATYFWFQERSYLPLSKYSLRANHSQGNTLGTVETGKEEAQAPLGSLPGGDRVVCEEESPREQGWVPRNLPCACLHHPWGGSRVWRLQRGRQGSGTAPALPVKITLSLNARKE